MSKLILVYVGIDTRSLRTFSVLMFVSMMVAASFWAAFQNRGHLAFRSAATNMAAGEIPLPMVAPKWVLPNVSSPQPMPFPFTENALLQFTSGGHVLGFRPKEVYLAAADRALKVEFMGTRAVAPVANGKPEAQGSMPQNTKSLGIVTYPNLWDGITLVYEKSPGAVAKSTYYVAPRTNRAGHTGSPVDQIRLRYNVPVRLDDKGNLVMSFETGEMCESAPVAWQEIGGKRIPVEVAYHLLAQKDVGFSLCSYDPSLPIVIDPKLTWNTFMGSAGTDIGYGIALDSNGNVYIVGESNATWGGAPVNAYTGGQDAFAVKLNSAGVLQWNTFMGSAGGKDIGRAIAVDSGGNVHVAGVSDATWGTTVINPYSGGEDAFVAKLNTNGVYQWNTFMGSAGSSDWAYGIAVDNSGNVYVTGISSSTWGTPVDAYAGGVDGFAAKLSSAGVRQWNTFMGSGGDDRGYSIAVDRGGNVYLTGYSSGSWGTPLNGYAGGAEAFVAKLDRNGMRRWNTFMGSALLDDAQGIVVDNTGFIYVAGYSYAGWGAPVNAYAGGIDAFVARHTTSDTKPKQFYFNKVHNLKD